MLPNFLVQETTVRECGESPVFALGEHADQNLLLTLGITHAMEQESLDVDIFVSRDGRTWGDKPVVNFPRKFYCGTYQMILPHSDARYLKAVWRVNRWGRGESRPFFRFYVFAQTARVRAMAGAA
ncbi:MAG TPA: hypothetical protein VHB50_01920 [Bryobacteraceae bacterium]|nr:hypothetical protein [Bryobacteraceae bacterium]